RRQLLGAATMTLATTFIDTKILVAQPGASGAPRPPEARLGHKVVYDKQVTALVVIDPYNDFISEGGKFWSRVKAVAEANNCVPHMLQVMSAARKAGFRMVYALHHRYRPGDFETWKYIAPIQEVAWKHKAFEYGTWGGEIRSEFTPQAGDI